MALDMEKLQHLVRLTNSDHQSCTLVRAYMDDNQTAVYDLPTLYLVQWLYIQFETADLVKKHTCATFTPYKQNKQAVARNKGCASWRKAAHLALAQFPDCEVFLAQGTQVSRTAVHGIAEGHDYTALVALLSIACLYSTKLSFLPKRMLTQQEVWNIDAMPLGTAILTAD